MRFVCERAYFFLWYVCVLRTVPLVTGTNFVSLGETLCGLLPCCDLHVSPGENETVFWWTSEFFTPGAEPPILAREFLFNVVTVGEWEPARAGGCVSIV